MDGMAEELVRIAADLDGVTSGGSSLVVTENVPEFLDGADAATVRAVLRGVMGNGRLFVRALRSISGYDFGEAENDVKAVLRRFDSLNGDFWEYYGDTVNAEDILPVSVEDMSDIIGDMSDAAGRCHELLPKGYGGVDVYVLHDVGSVAEELGKASEVLGGIAKKYE